MNLVLFYVWEDTRVLSSWKHFFDMHLNYVRPVSFSFPSCVPLRMHHWRWLQWLMAWCHNILCLLIGQMVFFIYLSIYLSIYLFIYMPYILYISNESVQFNGQALSFDLFLISGCLDLLQLEIGFLFPARDWGWASAVRVLNLATRPMTSDQWQGPSPHSFVEIKPPYRWEVVKKVKHLLAGIRIH